MITKLVGHLGRSPVGVEDLEKLGLALAPAIAGTKFELTVRSETGSLPAAQCDGEELPAGDHYVIEVVPRALRLIVPRDEAIA